MYQNDPNKVLTGEVRLSYANLTTPKAPMNNPNAEKKYSVTLLIPKTDTATMADIERSIEAAAQEAVTSIWGGVRPPVIKPIVHDGDGVKQNGTPYGPECKGHWVLTASSKNAPQVVGIDNINCQLDPRDIYSGMYARVTIRFFGFDNSGNRGVGCGLGNVLKTRDGEPLAGGASAASDFAGIGQAPAAQGAGVGYTPNYAAPAAAPAPGYPAAAPGYGYAAPAAPAQPSYTGQVNPITGLPM